MAPINKKKFLQYAELYSSIQGEGIHSGLPCYFIRTAVCDIRCRWCDTPQALSKGKWIDMEGLLKNIPKHIGLVQITGGEPLVQRDSIIFLIQSLKEAPFHKKVLLETGGHRSLAGIPKETHIVMDIKLPSSGEGSHDFAKNFSYLKKSDEIKFVVQDRNDFNRALQWIEKFQLEEKCHLLFSPLWAELDPEKLVQWLMEAKLRARMQVQLHKVIWGSQAQGV